METEQLYRQCGLQQRHCRSFMFNDTDCILHIRALLLKTSVNICQSFLSFEGFLLLYSLIPFGASLSTLPFRPFSQVCSAFVLRVSLPLSLQSLEADHVLLSRSSFQASLEFAAHFAVASSSFSVIT